MDLELEMGGGGGGAHLWVMKPSLLRPCHLCDLIVQDVLKHLVCDCICTRSVVNRFLGTFQFNIGIDAFIELAFCSNEERVIKMLTLVLETDISMDQYAVLANSCFPTLKVITGRLSLY